ncbi:methyltransferase domain-containing protein [Tropicimonas sp. TH_r6]|uniref:class I SAM-dependent DNA methyltransferase n=1 Tax=Tropicimonas sp. TH_r6 TaxID=3082085 RepID=UPI002952D998|nr:methyltransferase domain-containing protein [Tropicimonas sp. TH_r6]MDV7141634.1 methyltransferase domain-containing protein [Tropicimonas sp. TH_r6]
MARKELSAEDCNALTEKAIAAFDAADYALAAKLARRAAKGAPGLEDAARLVILLNELGEDNPAGRLRAQIMERIESDALGAEVDAATLATLGDFALSLGDEDKAEALLTRAHEMADTHGKAEGLLLIMLLPRGEIRRLLEIWTLYVDRCEPDQKGKAVLTLVLALAHFEQRDQARAVLDMARPILDDGTYEKAIEEIFGDGPQQNQREMAAELFDSFASTYDRNLKSIGNNGPQMICRMFDMIGIGPGAELSVLDAGCGTGLCAPLLRPYARHIHGCDVSVQMLELCKHKGAYDLLTRTDLNTAPTYPEGPFDLVVSGDVLVYFQDVMDVFRNIADVLRPGGWFVFTIEDAMDLAPDTGVLRRSSGRYAHTLDHISEKLAEAGLSRPKAEFAANLRHEYRQPIQGRAIAAQKLAILGASG